MIVKKMMMSLLKECLPRMYVCSEQREAQNILGHQDITGANDSKTTLCGSLGAIRLQPHRVLEGIAKERKP
jgi:hypothetical protein